jgi:peptide deformylase
MAVLPIRTAPDPVLRQRAKRIKAVDKATRKIINDMFDTLHAAHGAGLAAPQLGLSLRIVVIGVPDQKDFCLINPEVVRRKGERFVEEGCLSIPGYTAQVKRSESVTVKGLDESGKEVRIKGTEILGQALEHEIDHLNGVLYIDRIEDMNTFRKVTPKQSAESDSDEDDSDKAEETEDKPESESGSPVQTNG